jgi:hypothetical protein
VFLLEPFRTAGIFPDITINRANAEADDGVEPISDVKTSVLRVNEHGQVFADALKCLGLCRHDQPNPFQLVPNPPE